MKVRYSILALSLLFLAGCRQGPTQSEPVYGLSALTDKSIYASGEPIQISIRNQSGQTAFFETCCAFGVGFYIEKKSNNSWLEYAGYGIPCPLVCPSIMLVVNSGDVYGHPANVNLGTGIYRLRIPFGWQQENLEAMFVHTNAFTIN